MNALRNRFASLTIALLGVAWLSAADKNEPLPKDLATVKALVMDLQPKVVERGSLEARDNNYVKCEVKTGKRGGPKIKWIVENVSQVKKGDLIVTLDDAYLREMTKIEQIVLDKAKADVVAAEAILKLKRDIEERQKAEADLKMKRAILVKQEALYKDLLEQIDKCKIKAPVTGLLVYHVPERWSRAGDPYSFLNPGEPVQYGQTLLSIPDLSQMFVRVRIHESVIGQVKVGQLCQIQVDAFPGKRLKGVVKRVADVADAPHWLSPDMKVYQTILEFTDPVQDLKLKPDLSASCEILTEPRAVRVLAIPIGAILMPTEKDKKPRCLIVTPRGAEVREVELGRRDERMVEIKAGLKEGDEVVTDKRLLPGPVPRRGK